MAIGLGKVGRLGFIGLSPTAPIKGGYAFVNAEAASLVSRFTNKPADSRKRLIDELVGSLKTSGVWSKLDAFYVLAAHDEQAARRNWVNDAYNLTAINSPSFTPDFGFSGDGSTSYLDTNFNAVVAAGKFSRDDAHMGGWSLTDLANGAQNSFDIGIGGSYIARNASPNNIIGRSNTSSGVAISGNGAWPGHVVWSRSSASLWESYAGGIDVGGGTQSSAALVSANLRISSIGPTQYGVNVLSAVHFGGNLSAGEVSALYASLHDYMSAAGAA